MANVLTPQVPPHWGITGSYQPPIEGEEDPNWLRRLARMVNENVAYYGGPHVNESLGRLGELMQYSDAGDLPAAMESGQEFTNAASEGDYWGAAKELPWLAAGTVAAMAPGIPGPKRGIKAYHGSPHDFDKFSMDRIGTGEGAQAYGHGLYFAENEGVARQYRDQLAAQMNTRPATVNLPGNPFSGAEILEADPSRPGRMYEVSINADPEQFLDWDKPLSEQGESVRGALTSEAGNEFNSAADAYQKAMSDWQASPNPDTEAAVQSTYDQMVSLRGNANKTGSAVYRDLASGDSFASGSQKLKQRGIPGIKYLDQGSRGAGDGTRNYVVFDDSLIEILKKYGLAPLALGTLGYGASQQEEQPY